MRRRHFFIALATPVLAIGCTTTAEQASPSQPPAGAATAEAAYPSIGSKWKVRVTENSDPAREEDRAAIAVDFNGRQAYGIVGPTATFALDPTTFNIMGSIKSGKIATINTPDFQVYSWPLWVGKSWVTATAFQDLERGRSFVDFPYPVKVAAFEDVAVPAGTFKAFRIEIGGAGTATHSTLWYAPVAKTVVKNSFQKGSNYYLGAGQTTTELVTVPK